VDKIVQKRAVTKEQHKTTYTVTQMSTSSTSTPVMAARV